MSLKTQAQSAMTGLSPFSSGKLALDFSESGQRLSANIVALDALALAFDHVTLVHDKLAAASIDQLKKVADALSKRLTYLLEPISPIEVDADQCVVQMRSNPPARDDNGIRYYELLGPPRRRTEPAPIPKTIGRHARVHLGPRHPRGVSTARG